MQGNCSEIFIYQLIKFMSNNFDCSYIMLLLFLTMKCLYKKKRHLLCCAMFHKTNPSQNKEKEPRKRKENVKQNEGKLLFFCCVYCCYHKVKVYSIKNEQILHTNVCIFLQRAFYSHCLFTLWSYSIFYFIYFLFVCCDSKASLFKRQMFAQIFWHTLYIII